jgi:DNA-directed RNA polymerase
LKDGSCNVLQHYAALGRDVIGAQSVNLDPYDVPKDVYSDVLELVGEKSVLLKKKKKTVYAVVVNNSSSKLAAYC